MEHFLNHLGLYTVTETECGTTKHLQLLTLIIPLAFMELLLIDTSVTWIRTGAFSIPKPLEWFSLQSLHSAFRILHVKYSSHLPENPRLKAQFKPEGFYLQVKGSNGEKDIYREKELCGGLAWQWHLSWVKWWEVPLGSFGGRCL